LHFGGEYMSLTTPFCPFTLLVQKQMFTLKTALPAAGIHFSQAGPVSRGATRCSTSTRSSYISRTAVRRNWSKVAGCGNSVPSRKRVLFDTKYRCTLGLTQRPIHCGPVVSGAQPVPYPLSDVYLLRPTQCGIYFVPCVLWAQTSTEFAACHRPFLQGWRPESDADELPRIKQTPWPLVRKRTKTTEGPPLYLRNLMPTFVDRGVSRGQRGGSLTLLISVF
jgi:hypothetical protein